MAELKYWMWLSRRRGLGARTMGDLLRHFGSPENIYFARENEYRDVINQDISSLLDKNMDESRKIIDECNDLGVQILTLGDAQYPARLKNISDPPIVLYIKGNLPNVDDEIALAVVGTRSFTPYGIITAEKISYEITRAGGLVVSGLAIGIDSAAARGALRAGGRVIGVLGCGIDVIYPQSNVALYHDVEEVGAIISEYPPHTRPYGRNFPERNRILSGISAGVVVIEAPAKSGALITASKALEQGRDVFAVPGNVDSLSCKGSNALLKEGAIPAMSGADVIDEYKHIYPHKFIENSELVALTEDAAEKLIKKEQEHSKNRQKETKKIIDNEKYEDYIDLIASSTELSPEELAVAKVIDRKSMHVDDIIEKCGLPANEVLSVLTLLEISGAVTQESGKRFTSHIEFK